MWKKHALNSPKEAAGIEDQNQPFIKKQLPPTQHQPRGDLRPYGA